MKKSLILLFVILTLSICAIATTVVVAEVDYPTDLNNEMQGTDRFCLKQYHLDQLSYNVAVNSDVPFLDGTSTSSDINMIYDGCTNVKTKFTTQDATKYFAYIYAYVNNGIKFAENSTTESFNSAGQTYAVTAACAWLFKDSVLNVHKVQRGNENTNEYFYFHMMYGVDY